eukprot:TRINITY_DN2330_c0_g1_i1.p1 TRINITY_DN2330_c0_g1~~TRINITY_DN2330_c0_g1_i1.p1  ORF type:complete len:844 (+),score=377.15 TRINITY_DN2330_c0_g1_i1:35-2566(+)
MPKKQKIGKQRRDKAYWAAKEIGYRSRASFKLVQLNRKWEFLQKSNVCIDLCAAPGSWMQVAKECMPLSSLVVGIDLVPIKPIPGAICLQGDITSEKTRTDLKKELKTAKADVVLHDGAPNVGKNWINDAYQQSLLTLCSFKLASEFLCKGGWFVTKVFRSKDYQALMWVFNQFFRKVHATKPAASRNESAEIFVVCQGYLAPDKIDPKFLDPKSVFSDVEGLEEKQHKDIFNPEKQKKNREGYEDGVTSLFKEAKASEFIMGKNSVQILNECNSIVIDAPRIDKHKRTTDEIRECIKDIKVLGMKELRNLKKWKDALKKEFDELDEANKGVEEAVPAILVKTKEEIEDEEMAEVDKQIDELKDEERRAARRMKKKELKEKQRRVEKINLKMIIPGDEGPTATEEGLFRMSDLKNKDDLERVVNDGKVDVVAEDSDVEEDEIRPKHEKYEKDMGVLDSNGLWYNEQIEQGKDSDDSDDGEEGEELGLEWEENESDEEDDEMVNKQDEASSNPLITSLSNDDIGDRKARKAELWFNKIGDIEDDSDLEEAEIQRAVDIVEKKGGSIKKKKVVKEDQSGASSGYQSDSDDEDQVGNIHHQAVESDSDDTDSEEEEVEHKSASGKVYNKDGFEVVPKQKIKKRKALSCEELALGEQLIKSKKAKRDIMDNGWNRFMFNDDNLPEWFQKEEEMHMKKKPDVDPDVVEKYREMGKEMNVKTIKKVVEAKARRKRRVAKKLDQARKKSSKILEDSDIGTREKAAEINKLYKKAAQAGKAKEVSYVVAKKHRAQKNSQRPSGIKGPYKQVDKRMKKDTETKRGNAKQGKKRRLKGKQAKPTKQFNTNKKK